MLLKGFRPQFSKLGLAGKNGPMSQVLYFFHSEIINMDEKEYNDPIWITPPHFGRIGP